MTVAETVTQPKRRGRLRKSEQVALHREIVNCTKDGTLASQREIADKIGCHRATVAAVLDKYGIKQDELEAYKANQADILMGIQHRISVNITDEEIKKAPMRDKLVGLGIVIDKHRLITGQSTVNLASIISIATKAEASQHIESNEIA